MKINSIELKNFRPYYGKHTINFATDDERHITVIQGVNGAGKTSLFTALNWCLYGDDFIKRNIGHIGELVNRRALADGGMVETSVELRFTYQGIFSDREVEFCAKREIQRDLQLDGRARTMTRLFLEITNWREFHDAEASNWIQAIIPENVSVHFFFDGEKIDNFTRPNRKTEVESAIRNVLKVEEVERGMRHLEDVANEYQRQVSRHASGKLKPLLEVRETKKSLRSKLSKDIELLQEEVRLAKKQKRDIDARLEDIKGLRKLIDERKAIESELKQFKDKKVEYQEQTRRLANQGFIPLAKPVLDKGLEILREIPTGLPDTLLTELLDKMQCLCGRPIRAQSPEMETIKNLLNRSISTNLGHIAQETHGDLKHLVRTHVEKIPSDLKSVLSDEEELDQNVKTKKGRLEEIERALENFDHDEANNLEKRRKEYEQSIPKLEGKINQIKGRIQEIDMEITKLSQKINTEKDSNAKAEELKRYSKLAEDSAKAMCKIYELYAENMRGHVQSETEKIFKDLVWNGDHFREILLNKDYELRVIDESGEDVLPELSAGQRQILSLSFIAAMAKVAVQETIPQLREEPFPIVMDTAFGRLSRKHRENITRVMPNIANQLVLFVTDEELHGKAKANLASRIGAEYELEFDRESKTSKIKEIW